MSQNKPRFDQAPGHDAERIPHNLRQALKRIDREVRVGEFREDDLGYSVTLYNNEVYEVRIFALDEESLRNAAKDYVRKVVAAKQNQGELR